MKKIAFLAAALVMFAPVAALAVDLTQPIKTLDGQEFVFTDQQGRPIAGMTMGVVIENALLKAPAATEKEKNDNFFLSVDIHQHIKDFTFNHDTTIQVRKALMATQETAVYGLVMMTIDPGFIPKQP